MRFVLVTGTTTGIGKTVVTAALASRGLDLGLDIGVVKPAQTGITADDERDVAAVKRLSGLDLVVELATYDDPLAPDTAARLRGVPSVSVAALAAGCLDFGQHRDVVLVEGAGGVLVRLDSTGATLLSLGTLLADAGHQVSVVVVTGLALGTLNHTELTVAAIRRVGLPIAGLVLGEVPATLGLAATCNQTELPRVTGLSVLGALPASVGGLPQPEFRRRCPEWLPEVSQLLEPSRDQR